MPSNPDTDDAQRSRLDHPFRAWQGCSSAARPSNDRRAGPRIDKAHCPSRSASRVSLGQRLESSSPTCQRSRRLKVPIVLFGEQKDRGCGQDEYGKISQPELICQESDRDEGQKSQRRNVSDSAGLAQKVIERQQQQSAADRQRSHPPPDKGYFGDPGMGATRDEDTECKPEQGVDPQEQQTDRSEDRRLGHG
jgi:hypothetical protein